MTRGPSRNRAYLAIQKMFDMLAEMDPETLPVTVPLYIERILDDRHAAYDISQQAVSFDKFMTDSIVLVNREKEILEKTVVGDLPVLSTFPRGDMDLYELWSTNSWKGTRIELALCVLANVVKGLMAAHESGVVHGDIKLENILLNTKTLETGRTAHWFSIIDWDSCVIPSIDDEYLKNWTNVAKGCVTGTFPEHRFTTIYCSPERTAEHYNRKRESKKQRFLYRSNLLSKDEHLVHLDSIVSKTVAKTVHQDAYTIDVEDVGVDFVDVVGGSDITASVLEESGEGMISTIDECSVDASSPVSTMDELSDLAEEPMEKELEKEKEEEKKSEFDSTIEHMFGEDEILKKNHVEWNYHYGEERTPEVRNCPKYPVNTMGYLPKATEKDDMWALGIVLYGLLTDINPFILRNTGSFATDKPQYVENVFRLYKNGSYAGHPEPKIEHIFERKSVYTRNPCGKALMGLCKHLLSAKPEDRPSASDVWVWLQERDMVYDVLNL